MIDGLVLPVHQLYMDKYLILSEEMENFNDSTSR